MKNNKPFKHRAVFRLERKIPVRRVVAKVKATEIQEAVAAKYPDVERGSKEYPGLFQKSLTGYMQNMGGEELKRMEGIRAEWQETGPPPDVQQR